MTEIRIYSKFTTSFCEAFVKLRIDSAYRRAINLWY